MIYTPRYDSDLLRGKEEQRPWNFLQEVRRYARDSDTLLDIGCGTVAKTLRLACDVAAIYGLEPSAQMRHKARENIWVSGKKNIALVGGCAEQTPFYDNMFDIVICIMAPHDTKEIYRILKPGGRAIVEKVGDRDKYNFKQVFGNDSQGSPRGYNCEFEEGQLADILTQQFGEMSFREVSVRNGFWKTWYSFQGLVMLIEETKTISGFDRAQDYRFLQEIRDRYMTENGIETMQNRVMIQAQK